MEKKSKWQAGSVGLWRVDSHFRDASRLARRVVARSPVAPGPDRTGQHEKKLSAGPCTPSAVNHRTARPPTMDRRDRTGKRHAKGSLEDRSKGSVFKSQRAGRERAGKSLGTGEWGLAIYRTSLSLPSARSGFLSPDSGTIKYFWIHRV